jgi:hypothetical protein
MDGAFWSDTFDEEVFDAGEGAPLPGLRITPVNEYKIRLEVRDRRIKD